MTKRERNLRRLLTTIADRANAQLVKVQRTRGGHQRATFAKDGATATIIITASTPSDFRGDRNMLALAKRQLQGTAP
jgi:hypothetical protein